MPLGHGGFADDRAPRDAVVAVPVPPGLEPADGEVHEAAGLRWVLGASLLEARQRAGKVQGRRTTVGDRPPIPLPDLPAGGVRLATGWVEPAYLEPDASWCEPGGDPASPLANGGAFGGKESSPAPPAARELADRLGRAVRVVLAREDVVRLGPKRPPMAGAAVLRDATVSLSGAVARGGLPAFLAPVDLPYALKLDERWDPVDLRGPEVSGALRASGLAERALLVEGALDAAGVDRGALVVDDRAATVLLDTCAGAPGGARAGARVHLDPGSGRLQRVEVRVAAGDPLDEVVLRGFAVGASHMALGWVLTEGIAVDPETGEVHDLTIRSFGVLRAADTPPIEVQIVDDPGPPRPRSSDAVFAAVASATWNALARVEGERPEALPARDTRTGRAPRR
ncbi:MAG: hypothetical protein M5U14_18695 [Acidimicrobiia bacterium]|nr:hypothetical protein [Acidimicrobiia bacterium]